ncbi:MAG: hypothetical protein QOJ95_2149 [Mycobacterium sp.]|jgi:hypothetical protein|nr:hypothetical protein [Mycobacterium sp.]
MGGVDAEPIAVHARRADFKPEKHWARGFLSEVSHRRGVYER